MSSYTTQRPKNRARRITPPPKQGLYDPHFEHESCGVGFVVNMDGHRSNTIVRQALKVLVNLQHRGACGCEANTGDGAGILIQIPHRFFREKCAEDGIRLPDPGHYAVGSVFLPEEIGRAPVPLHRGKKK